MATPEEIRTKHEEFQGAVDALKAAEGEYDAARTPYLEKKAALVAAIERVGVLDDELEALTKDYEPPAQPTAQ